MTYLLFVNGSYFDSTRNNDQAFVWLREWQAKGFPAGLKFVRDNDAEAFRWLVPAEAMHEFPLAA